MDQRKRFVKRWHIGSHFTIIFSKTVQECNPPAPESKAAGNTQTQNDTQNSSAGTEKTESKESI